MINCSKEICSFHAEEVTLSQTDQREMRERRDLNREKILSKCKIRPKEFIKQGSYAMKTMVHDPDCDYDIDDGVYFTIESLKEEKNGVQVDMKASDAKKMLCDSLQDGRFNKSPAVKKNCVRVFYNEGYHIDMPVYRIPENNEYELASGDDWVHSRAADVEAWFDNENQKLSPDENNGRQFRRVVRMLKKFARSRVTWKSSIASGFTITKLAAEEYASNLNREDEALYNTMNNVYKRLVTNLEVDHPVTPGGKLTSGPNDSSTSFFRDKLKEALDTLEVLNKADCSQEDALKAWDKVFNTDFFSKKIKNINESRSSFDNLLSDNSNPRVVDKQGGGRYA